MNEELDPDEHRRIIDVALNGISSENKSQSLSPSVQRLQGKFNESLSSIINGDANLAHHFKIMNVSMTKLMLYSSFWQTISKEYPYEQVYNILTHVTDEKLFSMVIKSFSFFSNFESFPVNDFCTTDRVNFFSSLLSTQDKNIFTSVLRIFIVLVDNSNEVRDYLVSNGISECLSNGPESVRAPLLLNSIVMKEPIEYNFLTTLPTLMKSFCINRSNSIVAKTLLISRQFGEKIGFEYFNISFVLEIFEFLVAKHDDIITAELIRIILLLNSLDVSYLDLLIEHIHYMKEYYFAPFLFDLLINRYEEWGGIINDKIIQLAFIIIPHVTYDVEKKIVHMICMYFQFSRHYNEQIVEEISKFISDPDIGELCLIKLEELMNSSLNEEEVSHFTETIQLLFDDIDSGNFEQNEQLSNRIALFRQTYDQLITFT